jgi:acyl-CoA synthetase (AMP-forming)/AMP-acid ligase II
VSPVARLLERTGPLGDLARHGDAPALVADGGVVSYAELADRVIDRADALGAVRRLVLVRCDNDVETLVTYLAALTARHPVLLAPATADCGDLVSTYQPDVLATGADLHVRRDGTAHDLHADLALLLSTSGSTGSAKLVRLSRQNVTANARSIATYLSLTPDDRAATTLPIHYCYGLSVVNSHLLTGAGLVLTSESVVEESFWQRFTEAGATSFAGVPYTFDLLDSSGFADRELPTLRCVTQAGGRMPAEQVRRHARLGRERGYELVVMYGQTEATARMAYLPPHLAESRPTTIGIPVPGGDLRIDAAGADGVGELVYSGPNVMLGYAESPEDLAAGREVHELRTGDLARQHEDGLFELVGRRSRFAKIFGLRVDLDRVEQLAAADGVHCRVVEHDGRLVGFVTRHLDLDAVRSTAARIGLPPHAVRAHVVAELPLTSTGKPDRGALEQHAAVLARNGEGRGGLRPSAATVRDLYAELLGRPEATEDDSFVSLRGDSLSFVEASVQLEELLGDLPGDWSSLSARRLAALASEAPDPAPARTRPSWLRVTRLDSSVVLRAIAIVLVVGSHANLFSVMGGAHVLLAVAGLNLARFQLSDQPTAVRRRSLLGLAAQVAVPSAMWIGVVTVVTGRYDVSTALLLNQALGSDTWDDRWQFWFLEALVWAVVGLALLLSVGRVDRFERRHPFGLALGALAATSLLRYTLVGVEAGASERYALPVVLWCLALGWLAARSDSTLRRVLTSVLAVLSVHGFFGDPVREALVAAGVLVVVWVPQVQVPRLLVPVVSLLAGSSLFVYLTHWQVYPHLEVDHPLLATLASFGVGIACWKGYGRLRVAVRRVGSPQRRRSRSSTATANRVARAAAMRKPVSRPLRPSRPPT